MKLLNKKWFPIFAVFITFIAITMFSSFVFSYDFMMAVNRELGVQGPITFLFSKHWLAGGLVSYFMNYGEIMYVTTNDVISVSAFFMSSAACLSCAILNYLGARFMLTHYIDELSFSLAAVKRSLLAIVMFSLLMTSSFFVIEVYKNPNLEINIILEKFIVIFFVSVEVRLFLLVYRYFKKHKKSS